MKNILLAGSALLCLFSLNAAFAADDGATLYKSHCQGCHGEDGSKAPANGVTPIKGQSSADLVKMLDGYRNGTFGGQQKRTMEGVVKRLTEDQLKSVADHIATL